MTMDARSPSRQPWKRPQLVAFGTAAELTAGKELNGTDSFCGGTDQEDGSAPIHIY